MIIRGLGRNQVTALQIYVFDVAHDEDEFPGILDGTTLAIDDPAVERAIQLLIDAANSAGDYESAEGRDRALESALLALVTRVHEAAKAEKAGKQ